MVRPDFTPEETEIILDALERKNALILDAIGSCIESGCPEFEQKHLEMRKAIHKIVRSMGGEIDDSYRMKQLLKFKKLKIDKEYT